ncbi:uncharacterized protein EV422DRAFT_539804 [Fimicolochytrium jonesii]|uniref:uncharacterized protein n=1 Tax=Fimicolochytrium jonesii TaxID=1396493 RepID=UPI0022FEFD1E|nr:uncharacterized protein EV422DRAFT_539804 [Fimicolochytrium jonesii]KAI8818063.1 hypothetical protein EV422DRAFT_539804 [Fimicolochytrium jonesii]
MPHHHPTLFPSERPPPAHRGRKPSIGYTRPPTYTAPPLTPKAEYLASFGGLYPFDARASAIEISHYAARVPSNNAIAVREARRYLKTRLKNKAVAAVITDVGLKAPPVLDGSDGGDDEEMVGEMREIQNIVMFPETRRGSLAVSDGFPSRMPRVSGAGGPGTEEGNSGGGFPALTPQPRTGWTRNSESVRPPMMMHDAGGSSSRTLRRKSLYESIKKPPEISIDPAASGTLEPTPHTKSWSNKASERSLNMNQTSRGSLAPSLATSMVAMSEPTTTSTVSTTISHNDTPYRRFRRIARMVAHSVHLIKFLARILKNPLEWSWEYDPKTYTEEEVIGLSASHTAYDTKTRTGTSTASTSTNMPLLMSHEVFGVSHLFAKPKKFNGWLDNDIRTLLRKPASRRTPAEIDRIVSWCSTMKCMDKYPTPVQRALIQAAIYTRWHSSRQIVKEMHPIGRFYIILDGEVEITKVDRAKLIDARNKSFALASFVSARRGDSTVSRFHGGASTLQLVGSSPTMAAMAGGAGDEKALASSSTASILAAVVGDEERKAMKQVEEDLNKAYTITMGYMGAGESFDISFLTSPLRTATYTTKRVTEFLTIGKRDYEHITSTFKEAETIKQQTLRTHAMLRTLNGDMAALLNCSSIERFDANRIIVCQKQHVGALYFLISGTCRVVQAVQFIKQKLGKRRYHIKPYRAPTISSSESSTNPRRSASQLLHSSNVSLDRLTPSKSAADPATLPPDSTLLTEFLVVKTLSPGDFFGQCMSGTLTSQMSAHAKAGTLEQPVSVITNQKTTALVISKLDFQRFATDATMRVLREEVARYPTLPTIERAYMMSREWNMARERVLREIRRGRAIRERWKEVRDPYGIEGDGLLAWGV